MQQYLQVGFRNIVECLSNGVAIMYLCFSYYVGVLNKETMQMEVHNTLLFNMEPVIPGNTNKMYEVGRNIFKLKNSTLTFQSTTPMCNLGPVQLTLKALCGTPFYLRLLSVMTRRTRDHKIPGSILSQSFFFFLECIVG